MSANARLLADSARSPGEQKDWAARAALAAAAQQQRQGAFVGQQNWVAPTFVNSWANYGGGYNPAGYYKDPLGRIWLRGLLNGGAIATTAFQLPWAPANRQLFATMYSASSGTQSVGRLDVDNSGNVIVGAFMTGSVFWFSLDGLSFLLS